MLMKYGFLLSSVMVWSTKLVNITAPWLMFLHGITIPILYPLDSYIGDGELQKDFEYRDKWKWAAIPFNIYMI